MLENVVVTRVSALGWLREGVGCYFMIIILEGMNIGKANLQPESVCLQVLQGYYLRHEDLSPKKITKHFVTTFGTFV